MITLTKVTTVTAAVLCVLLAQPAVAQDKPSPVVELAAGGFSFGTDAEVSEGFVGVGARFYMTPRLSLSPDVAFVIGIDHSHTVVTGNLLFDFLRPINGRPRRVTPYVLVGGGLYATPSADSAGIFMPGFGVRVRASARVSVGFDVRGGFIGSDEAVARGSITAGLSLGG